jgi:chitinase
LQYDHQEIKGNIPYINTILKKRNQSLKTIISVGGASLSQNFSLLVNSENGRKMFAKNSVDFLDTYGFDGLDLDWEFPSEKDKDNLAFLLYDIREFMTARESKTGKKYILTVAVTGNPLYISKMYNVSSLNQFCDYINIMAYEYRGPWSSYTGHTSPLFPNPNDPQKSPSASMAVDAYLKYGMDAEKLVLGLTFIGKGFTNVPPYKNGLMQPFKASPDEEVADLNFEYRDIVQKNSTWFWDVNSSASWIYNPKEQNGLFITFSSPLAVQATCLYSRFKDLGGIMIWAIWADTPRGSQNSLFDNMLKAFAFNHSGKPNKQ